MKKRKSNPRELGDEMYKEKYNVGIKKNQGRRQKAKGETLETEEKAECSTHWIICQWHHLTEYEFEYEIRHEYQKTLEP